jgi:hypothetical protein
MTKNTTDPELIERSKNVVPPYIPKVPKKEQPKPSKKPARASKINVVPVDDSMYEEEEEIDYDTEDEMEESYEEEEPEEKPVPYVRKPKKLRREIEIDPQSGLQSQKQTTRPGKKKAEVPLREKRTAAKRVEHHVKGLGDDVEDDTDDRGRNGRGGKIDDECNFISEDNSTDVAKAIGAILGNDFRTQTELDKDEVRALSVLIEIAQKYRSMRLAKFAENFMACMVSFNRGSRKEVVASFNSMDQMGRGGPGQFQVPTMNRLRV